jgi:hypothetical protein
VVRMAEVAGHMEVLAAVGEARRRLLVAADLMLVVEVLRATAAAAAITRAPAAAAVDIGGIRSAADRQVQQRLLRVRMACLRETSSRSRAQVGIPHVLRPGIIPGKSRRAHRRALRRV